MSKLLTITPVAAMFGAAEPPPRAAARHDRWRHLWAALLSACLMVGCADDLPAGPSPEVPIQHDYGTKIVYGVAPGVLGATLRRHCRNLNGTFNRCGTICAPDAPTCAATCAFTCEDIQDRIVEIPPLPRVDP